jgi:hypothetical protein
MDSSQSLAHLRLAAKVPKFSTESIFLRSNISFEADGYDAAQFQR